jgi:hypothetical protein
MKTAALLTIAVVTAGCASAKLAKMNAQPQGEIQEVRFSKGAPNVISRGNVATVFLAPENNGSGAYIVNERVLLLVGVKNNSPKAFNIQETDIQASMNGQPLKVWTAQEVEEYVRAKADSARTWAAIAGALGAVSAGMSGGNSYYSGRVGNTTYSGAAYSQAAANAAVDRNAAQTSATFDAIAAAESAGLASLNNLLKATTVDPGGNVMGWVRIGVPGTRPARSRYELQVMAGGEGHLFVFDEAVSQN